MEMEFRRKDVGVEIVAGGKEGWVHALGREY